MSDHTKKGNLNRAIYVVESGWVFIAENVKKIETPIEALQLIEASTIRIWGTTAGLGEIAIKGPTSSTVLDYCGSPSVPTDKIIAIVPCTY